MDNGLNMVLIGQLMEDIIRLPCTAQMLQLVVGKGLMPAEALVAKVKRLILFFTFPKQMEKLIEIMAFTNRYGKRLKEINLVDEEWEALKKLTNIFKKFAKATDLLGGSTYTTISSFTNNQMRHMSFN
ncbi:hypothetical protein RhiirA4_461956 [Rhizophagus irregularis]|uniref:Uncharacterized protein n=1 Tax=Rhizophagus irregularis TaxID=588596 RepID=A0A2I1GJX3_9GLOM|nr:hypothetical protein RhiirA4_461956 [Rhizophagus irregularis]